MKQIFKIPLLLSFLLLSFIVWSQNDEFSEFDNQKDNTETTSQSDEFEESTNEFSEDTDEFAESTDAFSDQDDEFSEFTEGDVLDEKAPVSWNRFYWALSILAFTILAGIFVRFEKTRKLRAVFLLAAVVILGFYRGGPGIISSFQNTYLYAIGASLKWPAIILFLGLLPITYFFGKVFCGWVCYLGAIQEFLYIGRIKILQTEKAQKIMRIIRYVILLILLIQLTISQGIEWSKIGPFKVIFNLYSPNITGYVLLVILLISSLFIHRPFCKMVCPAGLIFGWITKIPGASILGITESCAGCKTCNTSCNINAITRKGNISSLDNQECIMCGDCMSDCKIKSIQPFKKGKNHEGNITLKGIKKLDIN